MGVLPIIILLNGIFGKRNLIWAYTILSEPLLYLTAFLVLS